VEPRVWSLIGRVLSRIEHLDIRKAEFFQCDVAIVQMFAEAIRTAHRLQRLLCGEICRSYDGSFFTADAVVDAIERRHDLDNLTLYVGDRRWNAWANRRPVARNVTVEFLYLAQYSDWNWRWFLLSDNNREREDATNSIRCVSIRVYVSHRIFPPQPSDVDFDASLHTVVTNTHHHRTNGLRTLHIHPNFTTAEYYTENVTKTIESMKPFAQCFPRVHVVLERKYTKSTLVDDINCIETYFEQLGHNAHSFLAIEWRFPHDTNRITTTTIAATAAAGSIPIMLRQSNVVWHGLCNDSNPPSSFRLLIAAPSGVVPLIVAAMDENDKMKNSTAHNTSNRNTYDDCMWMDLIHRDRLRVVELN
jgi:hypothetical protein